MWKSAGTRHHDGGCHQLRAVIEKIHDCHECGPGGRATVGKKCQSGGKVLAGWWASLAKSVVIEDEVMIRQCVVLEGGRVGKGAVCLRSHRNLRLPKMP
jgi:NDP-sugar pyrophosphorylase family protein